MKFFFSIIIFLGFWSFWVLTFRIMVFGILSFRIMTQTPFSLRFWVLKDLAPALSTLFFEFIIHHLNLQFLTTSWRPHWKAHNASTTAHRKWLNASTAAHPEDKHKSISLVQGPASPRSRPSSDFTRSCYWTQEGIFLRHLLFTYHRKEKRRKPILLEFFPWARPLNQALNFIYIFKVHFIGLYF